MVNSALEKTPDTCIIRRVIPEKKYIKKSINKSINYARPYTEGPAMFALHSMNIVSFFGRSGFIEILCDAIMLT